MFNACLRLYNIDDGSGGSDVGMLLSGADRHLDMGLYVVEAHPLFPYFLESV